MLQVHQLSFSYQTTSTLKSIHFNLKKGNHLAIIGESGCGKSTLLKLIYGLYDLDEGQIFWNDVEVLGPKYNLIPGMDFMKYLAQDFDLMPFITVAENVGKYLSNVDFEKKQDRINELLDVVEMSEFAHTKAKYLSGGQMQRVAIARVLALEPEVLLLDEPFSHIDNSRKNSLRRKLFSYLKDKNVTALIATHDSTDILSFANEVMVMQQGEVIAHESPKVLFEHPVNKYIASLFADVNEIITENGTELVYPHLLKIVEKSDLEVIVKKSYYRGNNYLIESLYGEQPIFFFHPTEIKINEIVYLSK
jgi:ABC-type sulfate/molybdate transport systems ATPase subunit